MQTILRPHFAARPAILGATATLVAALLAAAAEAEIRVEAFAGSPLGVGRVVVDLPPGAAESAARDNRVTISDAQGRVLYPAPETRRVRKILGAVLGVELPQKLSYYFLFRGSEPLELELYLPDRVTVAVTPQQDAEGYREMLDEWWSEYVQLYERAHNDAEYPIGVQAFLTAMWSGRLGQEMPQLEGYLDREHQYGGTVTGKLMADEAYRAGVLRDLMLGELDAGPATEPLPAGISLAAEVPFEGSGDLAIEPIATAVPEECFYVRFGTFTNYQWFRKFLARWRGDLGNMLTLRSIQREGSDRISQMLGLRESKLSSVLGPQVIEDVALVGFDPYVREGAALGVLFHAKNSFLLSTSLTQQRSAAASEIDGANTEQLEIAGQPVSYVSSPDGTLRSYYATAGEFHFVASSPKLIERFLEAHGGDGSLGATGDFLAARSRYPIDRHDQVFVHLSSAFFNHLASPAYRIELDRRLRSLETARALELAQLAAAQEGLPGEAVDDLVQGAFLPRGFGQSPDGSSWDVDSDGRVRESARGYPSRFVPIVDNLPDAASPAELRRYDRFVASLRNEVGYLVPLTACVHRDELEPGLDRISLDVLLQRYSATQLADWIKRLGPPSDIRVAPIAGDVVSVNAVLGGGGQPLHVFAGLRDAPVPLEVSGGKLRVPMQLMQAVQGYVGAWPRPDFLGRLLGAPRDGYDRDGFARGRGLFDLWVRRADDFVLFSFKRQVLFEVGTQLAMVPAARPAQAWFTMQDLAGTQYEQVVTSFAYARTRDTSASGSRFMNSLIDQLHVPPEAARDLANNLVGGEFVCPLGGEYQLVQVPGGGERWASTAATPRNQFLLTEVPPDYRFPLLDWFRGMTAELVRDADSATFSAEILISESPTADPSASGQPDAGRSTTAETLPPPPPRPQQ